MNTFKSHGKILLTGEYLVLHGAVALGLPTKLGQTMTVRHCEDLTMTQSDAIVWNAFKPDGLWFSATLDSKTLEVVETDNPSKAQRMSNILDAVRYLNPQAIQPGLSFETHLEFDPKWGLGSSSTLINNLAQWANVNPYELLALTFGGSGYDIACARADGPVLYKLIDKRPGTAPANFNPPFADHLFFVYQGKKQSSSKEISDFNSYFDPSQHEEDMETVSQASLAASHITDLEVFCNVLLLHEIAISRCTGKTMLGNQYDDFKGVLKSLGAWGGDFLLAATEWSYEEVKAYFQEKGLTTIFKYQDLIL